MHETWYVYWLCCSRKINGISLPTDFIWIRLSSEFFSEIAEKIRLTNQHLISKDEEVISEIGSLQRECNVNKIDQYWKPKKSKIWSLHK